MSTRKRRQVVSEGKGEVLIQVTLTQNRHAASA
jgi:hypothetical protein